MAITFNTLVEEIQECSIEEQEELRSLLDHYLIEARRAAIVADHESSQADWKAGKLKGYDNMDELLADLKKE